MLPIQVEAVLLDCLQPTDVANLSHDKYLKANVLDCQEAEDVANLSQSSSFR